MGAVAFKDLITFTRASGGGRFNAQGHYEWLPANEPRIDYDPVTGECRGLLIEEQRTNLLLNSATLATQTRTVTATAHTLSFYGTGSVTLSGAATGTLTGTGAGNRVSLTFTPAAGALTLTVSGTGTSGQLEQGAFPTSYIPTTTAQVTRAADVASVNVLSPWYRADEGTLFVECSSFGSNNQFAADLYSDTSNRMGLLLGTGTLPALFVFKDAVIQASLNGGVLTGNVRMAFAYKQDDFAFSRNASPVAVDMAGTPPAVTRLAIGSRSGVADRFNGHIRSIRYYPKRLSNTELQAIAA